MNNTSKTTLAALVLGLGLQLGAPSAFACGGGGVTSSDGVVMNAQRIVISARANGKTDVVVQLTVPETNADYAVLIPVPSQPVLDDTPISAEEFQALEDLTAPAIMVRSSDSGGSGVGCGSKSTGAAAAPRGVSASEIIEIGPINAVSITGQDAGAIQAWLDANGFRVPTSDSELLADYVGTGRYFIAAKRSDSAATGAPSSIGLHYELEGDHRQLSLAFARMGAAPEVSFTLFLAAPKVLAPSEPFAALTLGDLDADTLRVVDYAAAVRDAVAKHDSKAFVLESATEVVALRGDLPNLASLIDAGSVVTRATTVVSRDQLTTDAHFMREHTGEVPKQRYVWNAPLAPGRTELAFAAGIVLCMGLRRRGR